jgi:hypothetical protein
VVLDQIKAKFDKNYGIFGVGIEEVKEERLREREENQKGQEEGAFHEKWSFNLLFLVKMKFN